MAQHDWLDPSAFALPGGKAGVLMVHGFSGSPTELRHLGEALNADGFTVHGALVAGHGATFEEFERQRWQDWVESVRTAYEKLAAEVDEVFFVGQSTGAVLLQHLVDEAKVSGIVAMAPAFWTKTLLLPHSSWFKYLQRRVNKGVDDVRNPDGLSLVWSYDQLPTRSTHELWRLQRNSRDLLSNTKTPLLVLQGRHDRTVHLRSPRAMIDQAQNDDKSLIWLEDTAHLVTVDNERDDVVSHISTWIRGRQKEAPTSNPDETAPAV